MRFIHDDQEITAPVQNFLSLLHFSPSQLTLDNRYVKSPEQLQEQFQSSSPDDLVQRQPLRSDWFWKKLDILSAAFYESISVQQPGKDLQGRNSRVTFMISARL